MKKILPVSLLLPMAAGAATGEQTNILVIVCEDISPYLGCYGDEVAHTPHLDRFALESIRHTGMFTTVGVSSPSRYSLITGRFPSDDGANFMRVNSFDKEFEAVPSEGVRCYTEYLRRAGYYCTNNAKTDYQFQTPKAAWDECGNKAHWKHAPEDVPFFAIFNLMTTHESKIWENADDPLTVSPDSVVLPPYYPDCPEVRRDMAVMYSNIERMDRQFQMLYDELRASDRFSNTIVIFYSDNGGPLPRGKREIYDSGTRIPFMIRFPDGYGAGTDNDDLNMFVDIPATILALAGLDIPEYFHGIPMYGKGSGAKRKYVFGATDRFDEQVEKRGSIRDRRYLYVRNYMPQDPVYKPNAYRLNMPMMQKMEQMRDQGFLDSIQMLWFKPNPAAEQLFDCENDPHNINNLAADKRYRRVLARMRKAYQTEWIDRYNRHWVTWSEADFRERAYPQGHKPHCPDPQIHVDNEVVTVLNADSALSISYRAGDRKWHLYDRPFRAPDAGKVEILFERIGYKPTVTTINP